MIKIYRSCAKVKFLTDFHKSVLYNKIIALQKHNEDCCYENLHLYDKSST